MLRLELLRVKADLERELQTLSLNCWSRGLDVYWIGGLGVSDLAPGTRGAGDARRAAVYVPPMEEAHLRGGEAGVPPMLPRPM